MSPTMQITAPSVIYTPESDVLDRHDYGVSKNRKAASTGGGRAWSEDEEAYLLQTRLQKMPYKHIATHLKKTELACRLHYHQLSHGSNRRKRTTSVSSGSSTGGHSPTLPASMPSPIQEDDGASSRSPSPLTSTSPYAPTSPSSRVQLPSILSATGENTSPHLPAILPKPPSITLALANASNRASPIGSQGYPTHFAEPHPHSAPLLMSADFRSTAPISIGATPNKAPYSARLPGLLRLDCSAVPPAISSTGSSSASLSPRASGPYVVRQAMASSAQHPVDMARLNNAYAAHRASFWAAVAADYGAGANPLTLEVAWRASNSNGNIGTSGSYGAVPAQAAPITPVASPDEHIYTGASVKGTVPAPSDKTRISAILGIDANPMSPRDREMVRRLEEERCMVGAVGA